jgi:hypothetical protein
LLRRLPELYGSRFFDILLLDSLYAQTPVLQLAKEIDWDLVITLKQRRTARCIRMPRACFKAEYPTINSPKSMATAHSSPRRMIGLHLGSVSLISSPIADSAVRGRPFPKTVSDPRIY